MPPANALLFLVSTLFFIWLGRRLAMHRNRNVWLWGFAGALFPPLLLMVYAMKPLADDEAAETAR